MRGLVGDFYFIISSFGKLGDSEQSRNKRTGPVENNSFGKVEYKIECSLKMLSFASNVSRVPKCYSL